MSPFGTKRTRQDVRLESVVRSIADIKAWFGLLQNALSAMTSQAVLLSKVAHDRLEHCRDCPHPQRRHEPATTT